MNRNIIKNFCSKPLMSSTIFNLIDSIRSKLNGGYILCWHDISAEIFKSHVEALFPSRPIPLEELVERHKNRKSTAGCFALTFDDGVGATVRNISTLCLRMKWPVTFYIPTNNIYGEALPSFKIQAIDKYLPNGEYEIEYFDKCAKKTNFDKLGLIKFLHRSLYIKPIHDINTIINHFIELILTKVKPDQLNDSFPQPITWDEIKKISNNSIISFQSHGLSHTALSKLNKGEIENELVESKEIIEQHTGQKVHSFCYPYGNEQVIGKNALEIAVKHYDSAVTLIKGRLQDSNSFYLPRIDLYSSDSPSVVRLKIIVS